MIIEWKRMPRRGHVHHRWRGIVNDYVAFYLEKSRGHIFLDDRNGNLRTEHASVEAAQEHAEFIATS